MKNRFLTKIIIGLLAIVIVSAGSYVGVQAAYGRGDFWGYFSNSPGPHSGHDVLPGLHCGIGPYDGIKYICDALPVGEIESVPALIGLLKAYNTSGQPQKVTGSAFIINTMLGRNGPGSGTHISDGDWNEITDRLNSAQARGLINWHGFSSKDINSLWQGPGTNDDAFFPGKKDKNGLFEGGPSITIRQDIWWWSPVAYELLRECANPLGHNGEVPRLPNYGLNPTVDVQPTAAEIGTIVSANPKIENIGNGPTPSRTQWQLNKVIIKPSKYARVENTSRAESPETPCAYYQNPDASCQLVNSGTGSIYPWFPLYPPPPNSTVIDNLPPGSRVCFVLSVQPAGHGDAGYDENWAHSALGCTTVGKKPTMQVQGGDVRVGRQIDTGVSTINGKTYGSWVEYGALSVGPNSNFASGSGLHGGGIPSQSDWSKLTFANTTPPGYGHFGSGTLLRAPSLVDQFMAPSPNVLTGNVDVSGLPSGTYTASGDTVLTGGSIGRESASNDKGKSIIIVAKGKVTISGNIGYTGPASGGSFTAPYQIPQLVIIAKNIDITGGVTSVDAWLTTTSDGAINTCSDKPPLSSDLTINDCKQQLTINGPVITDHLYLRRTAGADGVAGADQPAEVFNLRADAYLWAQLHSAGAGKAQTVYTNELPPRF